MSQDPTKIEIEYDPRQERMIGTTRHKNLYFNVPYVSQITKNLWVGGCATGLTLPPFFEHLVSLYPWEAYTLRHELVSKLEVRMYDSLDQSMDQVRNIARWLRSCYKQGPTLVHCQAGLNRSNLIAATALITDGGNPQEVIDLLREKRASAVLCNDSFVEFLLTEVLPDE